MKWTSREAVTRALGAAIRAERQRQALSQEHVAHEAGLSVRHYGKIEQGTENVTIGSLVDIARVLGHDFGELVFLARDLRKRAK